MITLEMIREAILAAGVDCDVNTLDAAATFESLGFDSLDVYNVIIEVQNLVGVDVPDADVEKLQSINAILGYFSK